MALPAPSLAIVALKPVIAGTTWDGLVVAMSSDGTSLDDNLSQVDMVFKTEAGVTGQTLSSAGGSPGITIDDADLWDFTVADQILTLTAGIHSWFIKTTDAGGTVKIRLAGTIAILPEP